MHVYFQVTRNPVRFTVMRGYGITAANLVCYGRRNISRNSAIARALRIENGNRERNDFKSNSSRYIPTSLINSTSHSVGRRNGLERRGGPRSSRSSMNNLDPSIPIQYTTAASEFIYGTNSIVAALRMCRRRLYKLYIHEKKQTEDSYRTQQIIHMAIKAGIKPQFVSDDWLPKLNKMSSGRPHNGYVLEVSRLPQTPITSLGNWSIEQEYYMVNTQDNQSKEDFLIDGAQHRYHYTSSSWRYPLIIYLDGVVDEGNLGAVIRSAYYLGAEAIVLPKRKSAQLTSVTVKASAGAAEALTIFTIEQPTVFLDSSKANGWQVYAAEAPPQNARSIGFGSSSFAKGSPGLSFIATGGNKALRSHFPLASHPSILMFGGEGAGLGQVMRRRVNYFVGINAGRDIGLVGLDSLNISVAAALLCQRFLESPSGLPANGRDQQLF